MTSLSTPKGPSRPRPVPPGLLQQEPSLDPAPLIPQNPATGPAAVAVPGRFASVESHSLTDCLSLTVWCPEAYHARLEEALRPFGDQIAAEVAVADSVESVEASDNQPRLIVVPQLADALSLALADQRRDPESGAEPETLPPPLTEVIEGWCVQIEAVLAQVRDARGHITLLAARALGGALAPVQAALATRYDLSIEIPSEGPVSAPDVQGAQTPAIALMADAVAQSHPRVQDVLARLDAAVLKVEGVDLRAAHDPGAQQALLLAADTLYRSERETLSRAHARDLHRVETQAEANIQRLRHVADEARLQLLQREAETRRLSEDAQQTSAAASYFKDELNRRETTYSAQSTEMALLRREAVQLEIARKSVSEKGNRLDREMEVMARNIAMRDDRIQGLAQAVVGYEDEALALRGEAEALRAEVEALRRSTSWKLTAPVRAVSLVLRRVLRRG